MTPAFPSIQAGVRKMLWTGLALVLLASVAGARPFTFGNATLDLQEVTTNVDVYFTSMRFNRAANEWDVDVTLSNKTTQALSGPVVLLMDSFTGITGPLRADGVSSNQFYFDFSAELAQGALPPGSNSAPRTIGLGFTLGASPSVVTRVFAGTSAAVLPALAFTRTLNGVGQLLPGIGISETGPDGSGTNSTEPVFGTVTLGSVAGNYTWEFSLDGYLPVWRQALLPSNSVTVIPYPRLTARNPQVFTLSPLAGGVVSNQTVQVQFAGGSFSQNTSAQLTGLDGQALPAFLPAGWSPLQAFWLELAAEPSQPASANLIPSGAISNGETAALVEFNSTTLNWQVLQLVPGNGANAVTVSLPGSGAYALVVPDAAPMSPPSAVVGSTLQPSVVPPPNSAGLTASGAVNPLTSPASVVPDLVTATADVLVNLAGGLASGVLLRGEVSEHYFLDDGTSRTPPIFDNFVVGYQRPGGTAPGTLDARFPLQPILLFGADRLNDAVVHVDLFAPGTFDGGVIGTNGGLIAADPVRLLAGPGVFASPEAIELRSVSPTNFSDLAGTNFTVAAAFEVAVSGVTPGNPLSLEVSGLPTNSTFVLGRVIDQQTLSGADLYGVEPRARMHSDANGNLFNDEPTNSDHLPGLTGAGQYVLLTAPSPQGLVEGVADNSSGQPAGGLPVSIAGQPWLTLSATNGSFQLLAPAGAATLNVSELATGDTGTQKFVIPTNLPPVNASVSAVVGEFQVVSVTPADLATNVPLVTSVLVNFNRALNPATLVSNAVHLLDASNQPVAASVNLNLADTTVTLLPDTSLTAGTVCTLTLSTNLTDSIGRPLEGQVQFTFSTVPASTRTGAGQLVIYQPGATNIDTTILADLPGYVPGTNASLVVVHGTAGSADPGVPVVVANENSGATTTVNSKADGSFTTFIQAQEEDFISATFVSLNGARIYMPVGRQLFDDGSVGLYAQGGSVTATGDGGPIQITVPPNAIQTRTKFKLQSLTTNELATQLNGVMPSNAVVAGSALNLQMDGNPPTLPVQVSFPVDLAAVGYPTNESPTNVAAMIAQVTDRDNVTAFQVLGQMTFVPNSAQGKLARMRLPINGANGQITAGALDTTFLMLQLTPVGAAVGKPLELILPLIFGPRPVDITGKVGYVPSTVMAAVTAGQAALSSAGNQALGDSMFGALTGDVAQEYAGIVEYGSTLVADFALNSYELAAARPLSGALVTLTQGTSPQIGPPGRVQIGMVYATSGEDGTYLLVAPYAGAQYLATAGDPIYQRRLDIPLYPLNLSGGAQIGPGGFYRSFLFTQLATNLAPPTLNIASEPIQPAPGQSSLIQITASQPVGAPQIHVGVVFVGTNDLLTGLPLAHVQWSLTDTNATVNGNTVTWNGTLTANQPIRITLKVFVQGSSTAETLPSQFYNVDFTGPTLPTQVANIPPPDTNDLNGPLVVRTDPVNNGYIGENSQITVYFNKPIDSSVTNHLDNVVLSSGNGPAVDATGTPITPIVQLTPDQQVLFLEYPGLPPNQNFSLTLSGPSIRDLGGKPLNQKPSSTQPQSFTTTFRTPGTVVTNLPGLVNGRGATISGIRLYALDQEPQPSGNFLMIYDISQPMHPVLLSQTHLFGMPRDLVVVPHFAYKRNAQDPGATNDLVIVVGGDLTTTIDSYGNVTVRGQYLWTFAVGDGTAPQLIASPIVSYRVGSAVTKVRWAPPYLVYEEFGADIQLLGFVNLAEMIFGFGSSPAQQQAFPPDGRPGVDLNGDGDYMDPGERYPIPPLLPVSFYGNDFNFVLQGTRQKILDFSVTPGLEAVGVTLGSGVELSLSNNQPNGITLPPMYRTLEFGGHELDISNPTNAAFYFGSAAYPRWVSIFPNLQMESNGVPVIATVALVSLEPDNDGTQKLAVVDITLPQNPKLLNTIPISTSLLGGTIQSVSLVAEGFLEVAGQQNLVLLNPAQLLVSAPVGQQSPAIVEVIPGAGGIQHSLGSSAYGVHTVADSGHDVIVQSPPPMVFVSSPFQLIDPTTLWNLPANVVAQTLSALTPKNGYLPPANLKTNLNISSDLDPPNPALHYYVLMYAPGGSGPTIELGLEGLNVASVPLGNRGPGYAPVRAVSASTQAAIGQLPRPDCGASIRSLTAYRVSNDPNSPFYNEYLSRPFALVTEQVSEDQLTRLKSATPVDREILSSGSQLRAFIDPEESTNGGVGAFAAQIDTDRQLIYPLDSIAANTVDESYFPGANPPPPAGAVKMPGTFGSVCAQSGELRTEATDMAIPSPRMPIVITREIGNQDTYEGPFGVGWDFNYNQRITVLDPELFPFGLQLPIIARDTKDDSEVAGSQDVLFRTGMGRIVIFKWVDTNMPPGYAQDPLVQQFDYKDLVSDYYLPATGQGVFDLFVKFKDGRFERLTPDGVRYRYAPEGRLETIIDRYAENQHLLQYDGNGWLVQITDTAAANRYVQFGYYRYQNSGGQMTDPNFTAGLDMPTGNTYLVGKICRLRDYAGADVQYQYNDDGFLTLRLGKQVTDGNGGYTGRSHTYYNYSGCQLVGVSATVNGTPMFSALTATGGSGQPVAKTGAGIGGNVQFQIPLNNAAASLNNLVTSAGLADGSTAQFTFDKWGDPSSETISGTNGATATTSNLFDQNGLLIYVRHPEGNSETMVYDTNNPDFRSQGNLISRTVDSGPRGGTGYTETFQYDPSYNLKFGAQTTPDGFTWTYALTADKRDVSLITYGASGPESFTYNGHGQLLTHTDVRGVQTSVTYDPISGFVLTRQLGNNTYTYNYGGDYASLLGQPDSITLPAGAPLQFQYNGNLQKVQIAHGTLIENMGYDEEGHRIYDQTQLGNGQVLVTHSLFDAKGFLWTNIVDGVEVAGNATSLEYDYTPDPLSRVQSVRYPQGTLQTFGYDNRGNVTSMTLGDYTETYGYDLNNNRTSVTQGGDLVRTIGYDGLDRPTTVTRKTDGQDEVQGNTYYPGGEMQSQTFSDAQFGNAAKQTVDQIDELGRPLRRSVTGTTISPTYQDTYTANLMTEVGPRMTTTKTWDSAGYDTGFTDSVLTNVFHPDGIGLVTQIDHQEDSATYNDFFTYDPQNNRTSASDDLGAEFLYSPRADGSLLAVTNADNHVTSFTESVLGELDGKLRQDGMDFDFRHDAIRHVSYSGDPGAGFHFTYDQDFRLFGSTLRNGAPITYSDFNHQNMPQTVTFPGGTAAITYDLQRRLTSKTVTYQGTTYTLNQTYDALDRPRITTYQQDNGSQNTATYSYDEAGPLLSAEFQEDGADYKVQYGYYSDTTRQSITYPSGATVTEQRDTSGRLTGVSDANGNIVSATSWQGNLQPAQVQLGTTMQVFNQYDARGRLVATRVTRLSDNAVLMHLRYDYDGANNLLVRQYLHRGGKADDFSYDTGERLSEAQISTVPLTGGGFAVPVSDRNYNYHASGLDYLVSTTSSNLTSDLPVFATNWTAHDNFLLPTIVDGFNRGSGDPMGNVTNAELQIRLPNTSGSTPTAATLTHNGLGDLVKIIRADGVEEDNFFQPGGLRYRRQLSQNGVVFDDRRFVYDDMGRLLEEYEQNSGTNQLLGRYYYATGDSPDAGDLLDPVSGALQRYYFLKDNMGSVMALADTNGVVVERAWYDPFGQPRIEERDTQSPQLASISQADDGVSLLAAMSEPVRPATSDPGPGTNIVTYPAQVPNGVLTVSLNGTNVPGTVQLLPSASGSAPYSVLEFTPSGPLPTTPPTGFVAWWPADGSAQDVRHAHNGTLEGGATFGPGVVNQAFLLNGTSAYVEVSNSPALNFGTGDFTAALWASFKKTSGEQVLIEKWDDSATAGWSLMKLTNNTLRLALGDGTNEVDITSSPLNIPPTNWIHYAVERNGNQFTIFTNAVAVATGNDSANLNTTVSLKFGCRGGTNFFLNGSLDEITLYSRALSPGELTAVAGGVSQPGPVTLTVNAGALMDEWGNTNLPATVSFQVYSQTGLVYYSAQPMPQTAALESARSSVGSPFLFHGQYFDYDSGLVYLRARFYDPYSGMFFEPDPMGYGDSVNLYAGMGNNPLGYRDPTGLGSYNLGNVVEDIDELFASFENVGKSGAKILEQSEQTATRGLETAELNLESEVTAIRAGEPGIKSIEAAPVNEGLSKVTEEATKAQVANLAKKEALREKVWSLGESEKAGEFAEVSGEAEEEYGLYRRPEPGQPLYRVITAEYGEKYLKEGVIRPRGGLRTMEEHVNRNLTDSKWTSWTTDWQTAVGKAGPGDWIFRLDPEVIESMQTPRQFVWTRPFSNHKWESEFLIEGVIKNAKRVEW